MPQKGEKPLPHTLYIVIPCYNEEEALPLTAARLLPKLEAMIAAQTVTEDSRIVLVNDGSKDRTWEVIRALHAQDPRILGISLSTNRGHQNALLAGMMTVRDRADMVISMDADLQDDIDAMDRMVAAYEGGADVVYGVRSKRRTDSFFKRFTAEVFYRLMNALGANTVFNHADYRLMSRRALEGLAQFREVNLFLRGIVPMIGYPSATVYYERAERVAGRTKYSLRKMLSFAFEGITSLSVRPIRLIILLGFLIFLVSLGTFVYALVRFFAGHTLVGWTSVFASVWAIGGLLMLAIGIVGEYIGKIYLETKGRPRYLIESVLDGTPESGDGRDPRIPQTENADPPAEEHSGEESAQKGENDP